MAGIESEYQPNSLRRELYRFSVGKYYRLAELGVLEPNSRLELIAGEVFHRFPNRPYKFLASDFTKMREASFFGHSAMIELVDGQILNQERRENHHIRQTTWINTLFGRTLGTRCWVACQVPLRLNDFSEPEPDLMLLRDQNELYRAQQPGPDDVFLVVEVSDTSIAFDREVKLPLYAASGVAEVWIVDLAADRLRVYRRPSGREYAEAHILGADDTVTPVAFADLTFQVADLIG